MLNIDIELFNRNLRLTQEYCEQQLRQTDKNFASILRSINPEDNGHKTFLFNFYQVNAKTPFYTFGTTWRLDPYDNPKLFAQLFEMQISEKNSRTDNSAEVQTFIGEIFAFKIDDSLIDGAASVSSFGLLDDYNCPPIDTWFYLTTDDDNRILLAWIPIQLVNYIDDGISVNPENCIDWFKTWYPKEFKTIEPTIKNSKFAELINGLPKHLQR